MLPTLAAQSLPSFRVLIMDQSDDVALAGELVAALDDDRFLHVPHTRRGKSKALNDGLRQSSAPFVAFTDDDCELPSDWLATGIGLLHAVDAAAIRRRGAAVRRIAAAS